jgi:hypothetical protein
LNRLQPGRLPEQQAACLTVAINLTITPRSIEVYGIRQYTPACLVYGVAGLVGALIDREFLATKLEHLWHERQILEPAVFVERTQYRLFFLDADPVTRFVLINLRGTHVNCQSPVSATADFVVVTGRIDLQYSRGSLAFSLGDKTIIGKR